MMSHGLSTQNSPREVSSRPGCGTRAPRLPGCDTTASQTQFQPSGWLRSWLQKPAVATTSSQPSLSRSARAGPYAQPTAATCQARPFCSKSGAGTPGRESRAEGPEPPVGSRLLALDSWLLTPRLRCSWLPATKERSVDRIGSGKVPGATLPMTRLPALEYMLAT